MIHNLITIVIFNVSDKFTAVCDRLVGDSIVIFIIFSSVIDVDGLDSCQQGGQLLSDCQRLERAATHTDTSPEVDAGERVQTFSAVKCAMAFFDNRGS